MGRVTRAEAARQLGLHKSTLSRLCRDNPALLDEAGRVDVGEIRALRQAVINPKLQTRGPGAPEAGPPEPQPEPDPGPAPQPSGTTLNASRERVEEARAIEAELNLAERLGRTLRKSEVEAAIAEAGEAVRQRAAQVARDRAEQIARIEDVREAEQALTDAFRVVMAAVAEELGAAVAGDDRPDAA